MAARLLFFGANLLGSKDPVNKRVISRQFCQEQRHQLHRQKLGQEQEQEPQHRHQPQHAAQEQSNQQQPQQQHPVLCCRSASVVISTKADSGGSSSGGGWSYSFFSGWNSALPTRSFFFGDVGASLRMNRTRFIKNGHGAI